MKNILSAVVMLGTILFVSGIANAANVQPITVSTYPITESATMAAQVSGTKSFDKIILVNSSTTATVVTIYQLCGSTTTIVPVAKVLVPATSVGNNVILNFTDQIVNNPFRFQDICFRKADAVDSIYASVIYR